MFLLALYGLRDLHALRHSATIVSTLPLVLSLASPPISHSTPPSYVYLGDCLFLYTVDCLILTLLGEFSQRSLLAAGYYESVTVCLLICRQYVDCFPLLVVLGSRF